MARRYSAGAVQRSAGRSRGHSGYRPGHLHRRGQVLPREHHPHESTGADGKFSFSPPIGDFRIVVLHDQGYAEVTAKQFEPKHELNLKPWGRIEGTLRVGGMLLANQLVQAALDDQRADPEYPIIQNESRAVTDEKGHFLIDRLTPGEARVHWQPDPVTQAKPPDRYYQAPFVVVEPGRTAHLEVVQEGGRPLIGRLTSQTTTIRPWQRPPGMPSSPPRLPEPPYPADLPTGNRQSWLKQWRLTEAATRYRRLQRRLRSFPEAESRPLVSGRRDPARPL